MIIKIPLELEGKGFFLVFSMTQPINGIYLLHNFTYLLLNIKDNIIVYRYHF